MKEIQSKLKVVDSVPRRLTQKPIAKGTVLLTSASQASTAKARRTLGS
jgi:hypothetical protein